MPDLLKGGTSTAAQRRHIAGPGTRRAGLIWLILFALLLLIGGIETLVLGLVRWQDAAHLAAAPVCASGQQTGCRLDEQVTVASITADIGDRSGSSTQLVKVQTPDGSTQIVYAGDNDSGLLSRLHTGVAVQAELWNGNVIRLDDGAGHYLLADDNPVVTSAFLPIIGVLALGAGGAMLTLGLRSLRQSRTASR